MNNSRKWLVLAIFSTWITACAGPEQTSEFFDPFEPVNREVHTLNKALDTVVVRPAARGYGGVVPQPLRSGVNNFATNLGAPGDVLNDLLQFNLEDALHNTARFLVNSTIGLGGLIDVASASGAEPRETDFGETLHVWGLGEGAYLELPFYGPSTTRDALGMLVDMAIDPVAQFLPPDAQKALLVATLAGKLDSRYRFEATVDSVLYDSADSYSQTRLLYMENRRFALGQTVEENDEDLYEGMFDDF